MNKESLELRSVVYANGVGFHHMMAEYYSALHKHAETSKLAQDLFAIGTKYMLALDELLQHLLTLTLTTEIEAEIERTRKILTLLDFEMGLLR